MRVKGFFVRRLALALAKQYANIGGQAVIEGVMMRSPNAFVVAVRKPDGSIRLRKDQWYGFSKKFAFLKKPFFRGILTLFEAMANGIVSLNYSANLAMEEELKEQALKSGKTLEEYETQRKYKESVNWATFFAVSLSLAFGAGIFVFTPHAATAGLNELLNASWSLDGVAFHLVDGLIKAAIFVFYVWIIGFIPEIKRVFQYHGAEHKSISAFEAGEGLKVDSAAKFSVLHPRCGTSFIFFLLFVSIVLFSALFTLVPIGAELPPVARHLAAILVKLLFMFPVAGISYEIIRLAGKHPRNILGRIFSYPGMLLQRLTTREPDRAQLEVALCSIKAALALEEKFNLREASEKVLSLEEVDVSSLEELESGQAKLQDFLD